MRCDVLIYKKERKKLSTDKQARFFHYCPAQRRAAIKPCCVQVTGEPSQLHASQARNQWLVTHVLDAHDMFT